MFSAGLAIHVLWWRISRPKNTGKVLLGIFGSVILIFLVLAGLGLPTFFGLSGNMGPVPYVQGSFLALSLAMAYIATYPAIDVQSPSIELALQVAKGGKSGVSMESLRAVFNEETLFNPLIVNLVNEKFVVSIQERFFLTPKGRALARTFLFWGAVMKRQKGG